MPVIETSLGRIAEPDGDRVEFIVRTDVPAYQARLPKMGWQPGGGPGSFTRRLDDAPGSEAIFARFTRHVETMIRQSARLEPADWEAGLAELAGRAEGSGLRWWLYGSGALAVRASASNRVTLTCTSATRPWPGGSWPTSWSSRSPACADG
jgi:hypothetical protein